SARVHEGENREGEWRALRRRRTLAPLSLERRRYEDDPARAGANAARPAAPRPGLPAADRGRPAVRHGVLLQDAVGPPAGVPPALPEEPLPAAAEGGRREAHPRREDRDPGE